MKPIWKNIIVSCVSLALLVMPTKFAQSCSEPYFYDNGDIPSFFNPRIVDVTGYENFYYSSRVLHSENIDVQADYIRNSAEWAAAMNDFIVAEDVYQIIYETNIDTFLTALADERLLTTFSNNTFINALIQPQYKGFLDYLVTILRVDFTYVVDSDPWGLRNTKLKEKYQFDTRKKMNELIAKMEQKLTGNLSKFLKERYAYKLVVYYRYRKDYQKCLTIFDEHLENSTSILNAWGNIHKAKALFHLNRIAEANLALARAYNGCESKKVRAVQGFVYERGVNINGNWKNINYYDSTFALAKNPIEKVALVSVTKSNYPGQALDAIKTIIQLKPDYEYLPLLILREVNKLDNWLLSPYLLNSKASLDLDRDWYNEETDEDDYFENENNYDINNRQYRHKNYQKDIQYLRQFRGELLKLLQSKAAEKHRDFLNLAIGHLYFLDMQPQIAWRYLQVVGNNAPQNLQSQIHLHKILLIPQVQNINNIESQTEIIKSLRWLKDNEDLILNGYEVIDYLKVYLAKICHQKGKKVEAGLLQSQALSIVLEGNGVSNYYRSIAYFDKYASETDIDNLFKIAKNKSKTPLQAYLFEAYYKEHGSIDFEKTAYYQQLLDVQGTIALRKDNLKKADEAFSKLPSDYWKTTYKFGEYLIYDPFETIDVVPTKKNPYNENGDYGNPKYIANKASVVKRMMELKANTTPENLYLLANCYYNFTVGGNSWMMFSYGNFPSEYDKYVYDFYPNSITYDDVYYKSSRAFKYYEKVANHPKGSNDLKIQATYMLLNISDKEVYYAPEKRKVSPYFIALKNNFKKTRRYYYFMSCLNVDYVYELEEE